MQKEIKNDTLVSVIIPCYNAEKFIAETIQSVLGQSLSNFELICINDGSTDATEKIIKKLSDPRTICINKPNSGVSDSRNIGLDKSKGKFVLFLDADDVLSPDFLRKRVDYLEQHSEIGFCCSEVVKIDENSKLIQETTWTGAHAYVLEEVLSYNPRIITCPSNYLFRRSVLADYSVRFDKELSSSADRFFLIELSGVSKCGFVKDSLLYYRVHGASMSHKLTLSLLKDNSIFKRKILAMDYIPEQLKKEFRFKTNYILAGSYFRLRKIFPFLLYSIKSFYYSPPAFIKQLRK